MIYFALGFAVPFNLCRKKRQQMHNIVYSTVELKLDKKVIINYLTTNTCTSFGGFNVIADQCVYVSLFHIY